MNLKVSFTRLKFKISRILIESSLLASSVLDNSLLELTYTTES